MLPTLPSRAGLLPLALLDLRFAPKTAAALDGAGNNAEHPTWGSAGSDLMRFAPAAYGDLLASPAGASRPSARDQQHRFRADRRLRTRATFPIGSMGGASSSITILI